MRDGSSEKAHQAGNNIQRPGLKLGCWEKIGHIGLVGHFKDFGFFIAQGNRNLLEASWYNSNIIQLHFLKDGFGCWLRIGHEAGRTEAGLPGKHLLQ